MAWSDDSVVWLLAFLEFCVSRSAASVIDAMLPFWLIDFAYSLASVNSS